MLSVCISFLLLFSYPLIGLVLWDRRILIIIIIIILVKHGGGKFKNWDYLRIIKREPKFENGLDTVLVFFFWVKKLLIILYNFT
jgi:hypothetical protein